MESRGTLVVTVNQAWNLANFRENLLKSLKKQGWTVICIAHEGQHRERVEKLGCELHHLDIAARSANPIKDLILLVRYYLILKKIKPDALLAFTIKPNIYGSAAANLLGIPVVNNIAGLGTAFMTSGLLNKLVRILYKAALAKSTRVFFQNSSDMTVFLNGNIVSADQADLLPGSGIDLKKFKPWPARNQSDHTEIRFLLMARMLWHKGVGEFVEAIKYLKAQGKNIEGYLLGFADVDNPSTINMKQLLSWHQAKDIVYLGEAEDVREHIARTDCIVLPTYYSEGTPRSLLEGASMGKPLITTDSPGCNDVVIHGETGLLVPPRDSMALADAILKITCFAEEDRREMGAAARALIEQQYSDTLVIDKYLATLDDLAGKQPK